jgi:hypothetical protein
MACTAKALIVVGMLLAHAIGVAQQISSESQRGAEMSEEAKARTTLFESVALRKGFRVIGGRYGGDLQSDQLAISTDGNVTALLLGPKVTSISGDVQLDQSSLGGHPQLSADWIQEVVRILDADSMHASDAQAIRSSWRKGQLLLALLVVAKSDGDVKLLRITTPEVPRDFNHREP